jgi:hypothetical protein
VKVKEFIDENADNVATVTVNEYLINAVFGGDILPSEAEIRIGPMLTKKFRKALEELDEVVQSLDQQLDKDMKERICGQKL